MLKEIFDLIPEKIQPPVVQALGAIAAACVALVGVTITLLVTVAWNRRKHLDDRALALKKEVFGKFLRQALVTLHNLADLRAGLDTTLTTGMLQAYSELELVADYKSRAAAEILISLLADLVEHRTDAMTARLRIKDRSKIIPREESEAGLERWEKDFHATMTTRRDEVQHGLNRTRTAFRAELGLKDDSAGFAIEKERTHFEVARMRGAKRLEDALKRGDSVQNQDAALIEPEGGRGQVIR
jgi:hypothetical protein